MNQRRCGLLARGGFYVVLVGLAGLSRVASAGVCPTSYVHVVGPGVDFSDSTTGPFLRHTEPSPNINSSYPIQAACRLLPATASADIFSNNAVTYSSTAIANDSFQVTNIPPGVPVNFTVTLIAKGNYYTPSVASVTLSIGSTSLTAHLGDVLGGLVQQNLSIPQRRVLGEVFEISYSVQNTSNGFVAGTGAELTIVGLPKPAILVSCNGFTAVGNTGFLTPVHGSTWGQLRRTYR